MKVYRNTKTKSVIEIVFGEAVPEGYVECFAGEVDAAQEKHVPHLEKDGTTFTITYRWRSSGSALQLSG